MQSLNTYKDQITSSISTYEVSVKAWTTKVEVYKSLLTIWSPFEQLRENPVDALRIEFLHAEIEKQRQKLDTCRQNLKQFEELEQKMRDLAAAMPDPVQEDDVASDDEAIMDIREDLDEDGNIIKFSVTPQNQQTVDTLNELLTDEAIQPTTDHIVQDDTAEACSRIEPLVAKNDSRDDVYDSNTNPVPLKQNKKKKKKKKIEVPEPEHHGEATDISDQQDVVAVADKVIEHEPGHGDTATFNVREAEDGSIELMDDPNGYSIGVLPPGLAEMTDIVNEMDWENDVSEINDDEDGDESEDEYGRTKHIGMIPLPESLSRPSSSQEIRTHVVEHNRRHSAEPQEPAPASARGKKRLVFADTLVQGPTAGTSSTPAKPVLKKKSSYPIIESELNSIDLTSMPAASEPKQSRFKMERSSTDTRISMRHARPSQSYQERLKSAVADDVVEHLQPVTSSPSFKDEAFEDSSKKEEQMISPNNDHEQLFPRKINLAGVDLNPEDGTVKATLSIPKMSEEQLAAIRKKRELLGKKHKRRKSADPSYPVRSSSWDESQPLPRPQRRLSSGEDEQLGETMKSAKMARAKELLKAQDDIAWANAPISPDDHVSQDVVNKNPLAAAGYALKQQNEQVTNSDNASTTSHKVAAVPAVESISKNSNSGTNGSTTPPSQVSQPSIYAAEKILSPRPRKPPTPERRGSYTNIPSPLRQEIQPYSESKEVQFSSDVIKKLEPLMEHETEPTVVVKDRKARKMPPQQPRRKTSVDPQNITPTPGSPPPEGRRPGPLKTEEDGSVSHYMVRATSKSPPPHIAIHDLLGETPEHVRQSMKNAAISPTPQYDGGAMSDHASELDPMNEVSQPEENAQSDAHNPSLDDPMNGDINKSGQSTKKTINGIVEHTHTAPSGVTPGSDTEDEIDDDLHRKEIAHEYHRLRQRMVAANGGYIKEEEGAVVPLDDEDPGPGKRVSRFKAARLGQQKP